MEVRRRLDWSSVQPVQPLRYLYSNLESFSRFIQQRLCRSYPQIIRTSGRMNVDARPLEKERDKGPQSKRSSYVAHAWFETRILVICLLLTNISSIECKRRKIKCDGERPCHRCSNQGAQCIYRQANRRGPKESARLKRLNKGSNAAFGEFHGLYNEVIPIHGTADDTAAGSSTAERTSINGSPPQLHPSHQAGTYPSSHQSPEFYGPSSSEFTLNVVNGNLKAMGINTVIPNSSTLGGGNASESSFHPAQYGRESSTTHCSISLLPTSEPVELLPQAAGIALDTNSRDPR